MSKNFRYIVDQIPAEIVPAIDMKVADNVMLIKANAYITGIELYNNDYNFTFPVSTPPPTIIDNREYQFRKGRMVVFPPNVHITAKLSVPTFEYISLFFKKEYLQNIWDQIAGNKQLSIRYNEYPYTPKLCAMIQNLDEEISRYGGSCSLMLKSITTQIAVELLRVTGTGSFPKHPRPALQEHYIHDALEYININFSFNMKIEDICQHINLSQYHFIRLFKECTGLTPHEHLMKTRLINAQKLLCTDSYTIEETAAKCGFVNTSHFAARFKQTFGMSPLEYKRKYAQSL